MDVVLAVKQYISRMISESGAGMKVLLMDSETIGVVSMVYTQSEILQKEVFLFELLSNEGREVMKHLNAICFIRPTAENVDYLARELKSPKYGGYFVYFANRIERHQIEHLAQEDDSESVKEIKEFYADYLSVNQHVFSFNIDHFSTERTEYRRICDGILAVLLSLKKRPVIRYTASSIATKRIADDLYRSIYNRRERELFDFVSDIPPLLLILDRRDDPITPLLSQWTYQAMVHELLGIRNHRVDLSNAPGIKKDLQEVVLSPEHDEFYRENMYLSFGDIGANIKRMVEDFQERQKSHAKIESIADMKQFVENYPQFKKLSGTVSKHVAVVSELSRLVSEHHLMSVSELEQEIVSHSDRNNHMKTLEALLQNHSLRESDCLRLVGLFALRYEGQFKGGEVEKLMRRLEQRGISEQKRRLIYALTDHCGQAKRSGQLFDSGNPMSSAKKFFKGLRGVENVYTQHKPLLTDTLTALIKSKVNTEQYPFAGDKFYTDRPQDIIVFMVGGLTFEEAMAVASMNRSNQGVRIIIGGNTITNSQSFMEEVPLYSPAATAREKLAGFRQAV